MSRQDDREGAPLTRGAEVDDNIEISSPEPEAAYTPPTRRKPPAFQFYGSDVIAKAKYKDADLAERGLLMSMLATYWVDESMPSDIAKIARRIGATAGEIASAYGQLIREYFCVMPGRASELRCPDLDLQFNERRERARRQAEGGRKGGTKTQQMNREARAETTRAPSQPSSPASRLAQGQPQAPEKRRDEVSRDEKKRESSSDAHREWRDAYDGVEQPRHEREPGEEG